MQGNKMKLTIQAKSINESFARSVVGAFFAQLNPTMEQLDDVKTAVSEAVTNSIVHGYKSSGEGEIAIDCMLENNGIAITIADDGSGIDDIQLAMQPLYTTVTTGERSGMGFSVMQAFCDNVDVVSNKNGTIVTLKKSCEPLC